MKVALLIWRILFRGNSVEVRKALRLNARKMNPRKNGYEAEAYFLELVVMVEFFVLAAVTLITTVLSILPLLMIGEETIPGMYILYIGLIPGSLMFVHTWKSVNLEIIKARKIPYRAKSGYFTEVRNSDLIPSVIIFAIVVISTIAYYWG